MQKDPTLYNPIFIQELKSNQLNSENNVLNSAISDQAFLIKQEKAFCQAKLENKTNLIVNYLPQNMSQEEIKSLFATIGEIESCKLIRDRNSGHSLGYAFVNYFKIEDAEKAIQSLNGLRLQSKTIKVSLARPSSDSIKGANLYVSGLPKNFTNKDLELLFCQCGKIITSRILNDTNTGHSKGVGFIRFDQRYEAALAIQNFNGYKPSGATDPIIVKFANSPSAIKNGIDILDQNLAFCVNGIGSPLQLSFLAQQQSQKKNGSKSKLGPVHAITTPKVRYNPLEGCAVPIRNISIDPGLLTYKNAPIASLGMLNGSLQNLFRPTFSFINPNLQCLNGTTPLIGINGNTCGGAIISSPSHLLTNNPQNIDSIWQQSLINHSLAQADFLGTSMVPNNNLVNLTSQLAEGLGVYSYN